MFNKHNFAIRHEENLYDLKRTKKRMILFFNLNVNDAFDNVSHTRFFHNMKKRKVSSRLLK